MALSFSLTESVTLAVLFGFRSSCTGLGSLDLGHSSVTGGLKCSSLAMCSISGRVNRASATGASPALRDQGAKLKSGEQRFSPKCEGFFWPKSQIFRPKAGDLQKNKIKK